MYACVHITMSIFIQAQITFSPDDLIKPRYSPQFSVGICARDCLLFVTYTAYICKKPYMSLPFPNDCHFCRIIFFIFCCDMLLICFIDVLYFSCLLRKVYFSLIRFLPLPLLYLLSLSVSSENCNFSSKIGSPSSPHESQTGL